MPTILVVDDDPILRMVTCAILEDHGYGVLSASSADEAVVVLENHADITVVLTDVVMPGTLDGLGLVGQIGRRWPRIHVVVTSGRLPAEAAANDGRTAFLAKPFGEFELLKALPAGQASVAEA